jgi:hypothetical protein
MTPEEQAAIGAYKNYVRENLPPHNSLADLWYPDYDDGADIHLFKRYVKKLEKYTRKIETAATILHEHYEKSVTNEDTGRKHWRLGMIVVMGDCKLKLFKYKSLLEQVTEETFAKCYHYEHNPPPCDMWIKPVIIVDSVRKPLTCSLREVKLRNREKKKQLRKRRVLASELEDALINRYSSPRYHYIMGTDITNISSAEWLEQISVALPKGNPITDSDHEKVLDYIMELIISKIDSIKKEVNEKLRSGHNINVISAMMDSLMQDDDFISKVVMSKPDGATRFDKHITYIESHYNRLRDYVMYPHFLLFYGLMTTIMTRKYILYNTPTSLLDLTRNYWFDAGCIARAAVLTQIVRRNTDNGKYIVHCDTTKLLYWNSETIKTVPLKPASPYYMNIYNKVVYDYEKAIATAKKNLSTI